MSTDIVIPLKKGAPKGYVELRYALRSIEQHFTELGDGECFILGEEPPDWYRGGFVELAQPKTYSQISGVLYKLQVFASHYRGDRCVYSNDDILLMKPWSGTRYFNQRRNTQSQFHNVTVSRAKFILEQAGSKLVHDYELHVPIIYDTSQLRTVLGCFDISIPTALRTLYCNFYPEDCAGINDCKVMNFMKPDPKWKFFSSDDQFSGRHDFIAWLQATFPKASRWEK